MMSDGTFETLRDAFKLRVKEWGGKNLGSIADLNRLPSAIHSDIQR